MIDLDGRGDFRPRVLWTRANVYDVTYFSYIFDAMNESEKNEFKQLLTKLIKFATDVYHEGENERNLALWLNIKVRHVTDANPFDNSVGAFYSHNTLKAVKQYMAQNFLELSRIRFVDMSSIYNRSILRLNALSDEEIQECCQNPKMKCFLPQFIESWTFLNQTTYYCF